MSDIDSIADDNKPKPKSNFDQEFQAEVSQHVEDNLTPPPETLSPEDHIRLDMEDAILEEKVHHWGHILFAIFGFISIITVFMLVFVMSIAFAAGEHPTNPIVRFLVNPSLALLLAYATLVSLLLGLIGLGLGEWHHRTR